MRASLQGGGASDPGRVQAAADVCAQLEVQLERLELLRRKKAAQLEALQAMVAGRQQPAEGAAAAGLVDRITIDDIIANEGA